MDILAHFGFEFPQVTNHIFNFYVTHGVQNNQIQHFSTFEENK